MSLYAGRPQPWLCSQALVSEIVSVFRLPVPSVAVCAVVLAKVGCTDVFLANLYQETYDLFDCVHVISFVLFGRGNSSNLTETKIQLKSLFFTP